MKRRTLLQKILIGGVIFLFLSSLWSRMKEAHKRHQGALAIVRIAGPIQSSSSPASWSASDAEDVAKELHKLSEDDEVKAIVLRINSPGGTVGSVQEIDEEIMRCRAKGKKIVASLGDVAASGGYYLAAASDRIVANPGTITGSIGVILEFGNLEGLFQKVGLKLQVIKSGLHKDIGSPARELTAEERRMLQASIDDAYAQFFDAVREGRHLSPEKLKAIADGRIFTGRQALQVGLVDELGDQEDAIQAAIRLANLPAKPTIITEDHKSFSAFLERATSQWSRQPLESLQEVVTGTSVEYRWRP
jgi:protease-4